MAAAAGCPPPTPLPHGATPRRYGYGALRTDDAAGEGDGCHDDGGEGKADPKGDKGGSKGEKRPDKGDKGDKAEKAEKADKGGGGGGGALMRRLSLSFAPS